MNRVRVVAVAATLAAVLAIVLAVVLEGLDPLYLTPVLFFAVVGAALVLGLRLTARRRPRTASGTEASRERAPFVEDDRTPMGDSSEHSPVASDRGSDEAVPQAVRSPR